MLIVKGTKVTPSIELNDNGILSISGRSIPEDSFIFYKPILDWLNEYIKNPAITTTLNISLEYFNTSSSKCLLDALKILSNIKLYNKNNNVDISWIVEDDDEDMYEAGEDYMSFVRNINFKIITNTLK